MPCRYLTCPVTARKGRAGHERTLQDMREDSVSDPSSPDGGNATCRLCQPNETIDAGALMDHFRLFHPDTYESLAAPSGPAEPDPAPDAPVRYPVMTASELEPHGALCMDCGYEFQAGDRYSERLAGMIGHIPMTEVVCIPCGRLV